MDNNELDEILENLGNLVESANKKPSQQEKQKVLDQIDGYLKQYPENTDILMWKALYYEAIGDYNNAAHAYRYILTIAPNNVLAQDGLKNCEETKNLMENILARHTVPKIDYYAPQPLEKVPAGLLVTLKIIILAVAIYFCCPALIFSFNDSRILNIKDTSGFQTIKVNPLSEYDYLTKQQIYDIRKNHVKNSLFASKNYEPDNSVFGSIVDNKPWWGTKRCAELNYTGDYHERIEGPSKVSAQMNNPDALVGLSLPFLPWDQGYNKDFCTGEYGKFLPVSLQYSKKDNLIIAGYELTRKFLKFRDNVNGKMTRYPIQLSGLNARDFGYNYVYIYDKNNIKMLSEHNNITEDVNRFTDYIHLGGSCHYKDGCNNISPMQYDKIITVTNLPAEINLKLWKKKPANPYMKADMYYRIIFDTK